MRKVKKYSKERAAKSFKRFLYKHFANQTDMSEVFGVTPTCVNHWCTGKSRVPDYVIEKLNKIIPERVPNHLFRPDLYKRS